MQLFSVDATMFLILILFDHKKLKKPTSRVALKYSHCFSRIAAQTAKTEELIFQIVAYRETVYRTGPKPSGETSFFDGPYL